MAQRREIWISATMLAGALIGAVARPAPAAAQLPQGIYIGAGVGYSILSKQSVNVDPVLAYSGSHSIGANNSFNGGVALLASVGYAVGNGLRVELETSYRHSAQTRSSASGTTTTSTSIYGVTTTTTTPGSSAGGGSENKYGVMANVFYDFDLHVPWVVPYIGVGAGIQAVDWNHVSTEVVNLTTATTSPYPVTANGVVGGVAYQAVIGLAFPIDTVPGLAVTAEYRYLGVAGARNYGATAALPTVNASTKVHAAHDTDQSILVGLRYAFNQQPPPQAGGPQGYVPGAPTRVFLVFFDWDRADLTQRARDVIAEAVRQSAQIPHTRIEVTGHTDTSGTAAYNLRLSQARAEAVAEEMTRWGVPRSVMDIHGLGEANPLVPTGPGVREPQNRRVEIVYR